MNLLLILISFACSAHYASAYITYIEAKYPLKGTPSPPGSPWPLPQKWVRSNEVFTLNRDHFVLKTAKGLDNCDIVAQAVDRYRGLVFGDPNGIVSPDHTELDELTVKVDNGDCGHPKLGDDESYSIDIVSGDRSAMLQAKTVWGALRGLETFSQLVYQNDTSGAYLINATQIQDWPQFKYRGFMLDTSRHFMPMKVLLDNLDAMAYNKFNVFHWHIVDDQSYPLESKLYPNLTRLGAYSARHVYSHENVSRVVNEARLRGIRVIPEIDTPGHTQALGRSFPELLTTCYGADGMPFTSIYAKHAKAEILNPMMNETYTILKSIFAEVHSLFPDEYIHLGMDEVYYDCWESNPDIRKFMQDNDMKTAAEVEQYYVRRTLQNVKDIGYKYMTWQDPVDNGVKLAEDAVVQVWKDTELVSTFKTWQEYIVPIAQQNYEIVLSSCWYLNYISYGEDWKKYYNCNPRDFNGTEEEKAKVIGGEAAMWGEFVDGTNLLQRVWQVH
ncbi:Beta-hexosaminidase subunit alpha [Halotydeus destructor]|nr:Beta-hexosaminidase subunit alpha [Halotydeus destructor]